LVPQAFYFRRLGFPKKDIYHRKPTATLLQFLSMSQLLHSPRSKESLCPLNELKGADLRPLAAEDDDTIALWEKNDGV
jgi:hypothetical protein